MCCSNHSEPQVFLMPGYTTIEVGLFIRDLAIEQLSDDTTINRIIKASAKEILEKEVADLYGTVMSKLFFPEALTPKMSRNVAKHMVFETITNAPGYPELLQLLQKRLDEVLDLLQTSQPEWLVQVAYQPEQGSADLLVLKDQAPLAMQFLLNEIQTRDGLYAEVKQ